ncbi:MAG: quinol dehydrogenase ferredoxin subunit NapH [Gammaproteobacteria bacterium]|nr:quinol dehydrogenase ferredoxin subunit NapH [Gammaproteobacteria bacterium]
MSRPLHPGRDARINKGWLIANKWLFARRFSQLSILLIFLVGPWFGIWIISGNLNSSLILETVPLTDPYILLQSLFAGHTPQTNAIIGAMIVLFFYIVVGGRVYCAWVCPVNMVTDAAQWLRDQFKISGSSSLSRKTRYWILAATLLLAFSTGSIAWEMVNPVSMLHRGLIFGMGLAWFIVLAVFMLDLLVSRRAWCSHLCPVGAFYSLLGTHSLIRVRADAREQCDDCMDCFMVCPEQQVIRPALKGHMNKNNIDVIGPVITSPNCTNCGRCIDACAKDVFHFGLRTNNVAKNNTSNLKNINEQLNHSSGVEVL